MSTLKKQRSDSMVRFYQPILFSSSFFRPRPRPWTLRRRSKRAAKSFALQAPKSRRAKCTSNSHIQRCQNAQQTHPRTIEDDLLKLWSQRSSSNGTLWRGWWEDFFDDVCSLQRSVDCNWTVGNSSHRFRVLAFRHSRYPSFYLTQKKAESFIEFIWSSILRTTLF